MEDTENMFEVDCERLHIDQWTMDNQPKLLLPGGIMLRELLLRGGSLGPLEYSGTFRHKNCKV